MRGEDEGGKEKEGVRYEKGKGRRWTGSGGREGEGVSE